MRQPKFEIRRSGRSPVSLVFDRAGLENADYLSSNSILSSNWFRKKMADGGIAPAIADYLYTTAIRLNSFQGGLSGLAD